MARGVPSGGVVEIQTTGGSGHMGTPCEQTDTTDNVENTFSQPTYAGDNNLILGTGIHSSIEIKCFFSQIVDAMGPKFHRMNEAVEEIRNKVQDVFNSGQTFTREDRQFDQYEICCESSGLTENPNFPNVSNIASSIASLGVLMINSIQVHRISSNSLFSSSLNDTNGFHATFLYLFPLWCISIISGIIVHFMSNLACYH